MIGVWSRCTDGGVQSWRRSW